MITKRLPVGPLVVAGAGVLLLSTAAFFRVSLLPSIGDSLSLSVADLGVLTMAFGVGRLLADVPAGRLADRVAPSTVFALAGALVAGGSFAFAAAQIHIEAYAAAFTIGVGSSIANTMGMTVFSGVAQERRGMAMAVFSACLLGGQSFGPLLAGAFSALGTWRTAEAVAGALALGTAGALLVGGRSSRGRQDAEGMPGETALTPA